MSNHIYNPQLAQEKQVVKLFGSFTIGATGAVGTVKGLGVSGVVRNSLGNYTITLKDKFDRLLNVSGGFISNAVGGSGVLKSEISNDPATLQATFKADKTFDVQFYGLTGGQEASLTSEGLSFYAQIPGTLGNTITFQKTAGATAGAEVVTVTGKAIVVQIEDGVSTAAQVAAALLNANQPEVTAELTQEGVTLYSKIPGAAGNAITYVKTTGATAGSEVVTVTANEISVQVEDGVSTATQVVAALAANDDAMNLVTAEASTGATTQTALASTPLAGGVDAVSIGNDVENLVSVIVGTGATVQSAGAAEALTGGVDASVLGAVDAASGSTHNFCIEARRSSVGPS
jgi:hypothetical protein